MDQLRRHGKLATASRCVLGDRGVADSCTATPGSVLKKFPESDFFVSIWSALGIPRWNWSEAAARLLYISKQTTHTARVLAISGMSDDSHSDGELEARLRKVCAELHQRLREGEKNVALEVLNREPEFASNDEFAIELIYAEFVALEEMGAKPSRTDTLARFPQWRTRLERLLKVHDALSEHPGPDVAEADDTAVGPDQTIDGHEGHHDAQPPPPLRQIANYVLLEEIARGGMGIVYRAKQIGLNRVVAVKSIRSVDASESERARFRAEAESAATLKHPHIVQIYDVGEHDGLDFLSMEYVAGGSLAKRLEEDVLSIHGSAQLIATIAEAMHFAHQQGIVHRDLKPANILLDGEVPKIGDFGLAKRMLEQRHTQTRTGSVLGTPSYMSPEQAEGRSVGPSADVWALGAILYEMLTWRPPFVGDTALATLDLIREREPDPLSSLMPNIPRDLETICLKCLSKEPANRYSSAQALADDLNRFLDHQPIHARRVSVVERSWRWMRRRPAISGLAATLLLVLLVGGGVVAWQYRHADELSRSANETKQRADEIEQRADEMEQWAATVTEEAGESLRAAKHAIERLSLLGATLHEQPGMGATARDTVEEALEQYQRLLAKHGDDHAVRWEAARGFGRAAFIQFELGQFSAAEKTFTHGLDVYASLDDLVEIEFERAGVRLQLGHCQRNLDKWDASKASYEAAVAILERMRESHPDDNRYALRLANTFVNLCVVLKQQQRNDQAAQVYCRAMRLQRHAVERKVGVAVGMSAEHDDRTPRDDVETEILAAKQLRHLVEERGQATLTTIVRGRYFSELAISLDELGLLLLQQGSIELAEIAMLESLQLRQLGVRYAKHDGWRSFLEARSHSHLGNLESTRSDFESAALAHESAVDILEALSQDFPHRLPYHSQLGTAYTELARALRACRRYEDALVHHREAVAIHERVVSHDESLHLPKQDLARSVRELGRTLQQFRDQTGEAIPYLRRACELNPSDHRLANELAWTWAMEPEQGGLDASAALALAERAVKLRSRRPSYWNTLGVVHYRNGDDARAIDALTRSAELRDGGDVFDWLFLAMAHARQGNRQLAVEYADRVEVWCQTQDQVSEDIRRVQAEMIIAVKRDEL